MKEQLITFNTARLAKEKGFNDCKVVELENGRNFNMTRCCSYSNDDKSAKHRKFYSQNNPHYLAPTQSLLQKWLREKHDIHTAATGQNIGGNVWVYTQHKNVFTPSSYSKDSFKTYEEALEIGLQEALKLIETT
jgi:predicted transcriptional regulator